METPHFHIILVNPEIPPNTGNIARLCAATNTVLHLVHPLGFSTEDRYLKRAGLDYWAHVDVRHQPSLEAAIGNSGHGPIFYFSTKAGTSYDRARYVDGARLVFGCETKGLPLDILKSNKENCFRIPMWGCVRSLNLSTSVGIVAYEAYRQLNAWRPPDPLI